MDVPPPAGATVVRAGSAEELRAAMHVAAAGSDVVVMAAAVADFRPASVGDHKVKRSEQSEDSVLPLAQNADILRELVLARDGSSRPVLVGFAAETGQPGRDVLTLGREKLQRKGCDLLVVNDVSEGRVFGRPDNEVSILGRGGLQVDVPLADKAQIADAIWDAVVRTLAE